MPPKKRSKKDFSEIERFEEADVTNSDDDYSDGERELLEKVRKKRVVENFDSDDEVYGMKSDEHDSMDSDIERPHEDDDDLPDERAWGRKKQSYFMTDYVDPDYATTNEKDMADAELEEKEARNIQQRLAEQLDDADFGLDLLQVDETAGDDNDKEEIVKTDLSKLSKRQKLTLVQKENPEFHALVDDLKERMSEAKQILAPFLKLAESENLPECRALNFIKTKYQLILNYCVNITFYLMLKAKKILITNHPVIKRLAQYRQLMKQLEEGQGKLLIEAQEILTAKQSGKTLYNIFDSSELSAKKIDEKLAEKRRVKIPETAEVEEELEIDGDDDEEREEEERMESDDDDNDEEQTPPELMTVSNIGDEKRPINHQIAKNKGLTPHRKKEQRNPRVKHRNKYRKAKIRRKGAVREVRKEVTRYGGEISGIKASVKKSIKLK